MVKFKDYYQTLGVSRKATDKEIKAAYRKLARQHHPDANKGNKACEEKFKEISEAYEVLKDPEKRKRYDMLGADWKAGADFRPPPDWGGFTFDFGDLGSLNRGVAFSDFFEMLFGQGFGTTTAGAPQRGFRGQRWPQTGDQEADIELSVEELASGTTRTLEISTAGQKTRMLEVRIPRGVRAGSKVRVPAQAQKPQEGGRAHDLYLRVKVKPHPYYTVEGDNLISQLELSPAQAAVGGEVTVKTIDGLVRIKVPSCTQSGRLLRLKGKGLPTVKDSRRGDQLVRTKIVIPSQLTEKQRKLYEELLQLERNKT